MKVFSHLTVIGFALLASMSTLAQEEQFLEPAKKSAQAINESAQESQETINNIAGQIDNKLQQYKTLMKEIEGLNVYNEQLRKQIQNQQDDMSSLKALLYQTRDASAQGVWNKQTRQWEELDSSYRTQVTKGLRIAKKQLAPDLLMVPVAVTD